MTAPPLVQARNVCKTYRSQSVQVAALRGISLDIHRGEMLAVVGPSGCGKTTLLNCLSGLDGIDDGEVILDGEALHRLSDRRRAAHRCRTMGFVFQFFNLLTVLSAVENVELPLLLAGARPAAARRRASELLERLGLGGHMAHKPAQLSGGQQQRVAIARALVNRPAIVWADEPTGNLDSEMGSQVVELITDLNRQEGQTFVLVTHDPAVSDSAHRVVHMQDGHVLAGTEAELGLLEGNP